MMTRAAWLARVLEGKPASARPADQQLCRMLRLAQLLRAVGDPTAVARRMPERAHSELRRRPLEARGW